MSVAISSYVVLSSALNPSDLILGRASNMPLAALAASLSLSDDRANVICWYCAYNSEKLPCQGLSVLLSEGMVSVTGEEVCSVLAAFFSVLPLHAVEASIEEA